MLPNSWFKKEKPMLGWTGLGGGGTNFILGGGAATASGGTIVDNGSRVWHVMLDDEDFVAPKDLTSVEILLLGGGGGGGGGNSNNANTGGGGGSGGYLHVSAFTLTAATYPVTIGDGGGPGTSTGNGGFNGGTGGNTQFPHPYGNLIGYGGGGGGANNTGSGQPGGSGGGGAGAYDGASTPVAGGPKTQPGYPTGSWPGPITLTKGGGNGGAGTGGTAAGASGGGGGAGGNASSRSGDNGGAGGTGKTAPTDFPAPEIGPAIPSTAPTQGGTDPSPNNIQTDWIAAAFVYGGGGGGGGTWSTSGEDVYPGDGGAAGPGGGGLGGYGPNQGPANPTNTNPFPSVGWVGINYRGAGGGGASRHPSKGGEGGKGICIVTYPTSQ